MARDSFTALTPTLCGGVDASVAYSPSTARSHPRLRLPGEGDYPPTDLTGRNAWNSNQSNLYQFTVPNSYEMDRFCIARHGQSINIVFFDGHAETVPLANLWGLQWSPMSAVGMVSSRALPKQ
jgi:prepilin-type processing-associated H-X9-DG protein